MEPTLNPISEKLKEIARIKAPLVRIETPDIQSTILDILRDLPKALFVCWDAARGIYRPPIGRPNEIFGIVNVDTPLYESQANPFPLLQTLMERPNQPDKKPFTYVLMSNLQAFLDPTSPAFNIAITQAVSSLRDRLKTQNICLVSLGPIAKLPPEIEQDFIVLKEPLPTHNQYIDMIKRNVQANNIQTTDDIIDELARSLRGLPLFAAEQGLFLSSQTDSNKITTLHPAIAWDFKCNQTSQMQGVKVKIRNPSYSDMKGVKYACDIMTRLNNGPRPMSAVLFIDELEKTAVTSTKTESSGTSNSVLAALLKHIENNKMRCVLLVGPAGSGKSYFAECTAGQFDRPLIDCDINSLKGGIVGETEKNIRSALTLIDGLGGPDTLLIAAANSTEGIPEPLLSRFTQTFYLELPSHEQRLLIWDYWTKKFDLDYELPPDEGFSPRNIQRCCSIAYDFQFSLIEAAENIVPESRRSEQEIIKLRKEAITNGYTNPRIGGPYRTDTTPTNTTRRISL